MIRVWGRSNSANVQKVLWCCSELRLDFDLVEAGGDFGKTRDSAYLVMNPTGLVPLLEIDGFPIWESNTIMRYLAAVAGSPLYPDELRERSVVDRWLDWQLSALTDPMRHLFVNLIRLPDGGDRATVDVARVDAATNWMLLDRQLQEVSYVAGASFTLADIAIAPFAFRWFALPIERPELGALRRWFENVAKRDGFRDHVDQPLR
jgi:glutathione S-transferase